MGVYKTKYNWLIYSYCLNKDNCENYVPDTGCDSIQKDSFKCQLYKDKVNKNIQEEGDR